MLICKKILFPFTDVVCTPSCFELDLGYKGIKFNGYMELAYLHPKYFIDKSNFAEHLNFNKSGKNFLLRFVSWEASHDWGKKGLDLATKLQLVEGLSKFGRVLDFF